jgi:quercetin dioxygenase-like cupin family protein
MSERTKQTVLLDACVGKAESLATLTGYAEDSIVSKTILDKGSGTITLFAFDKGQRLSEHTSPYDAVVQVVDGHGHLVIGGEGVDVAAGELVIMPANVPHSVVAAERFKMLLIMIRG